MARLKEDVIEAVNSLKEDKIKYSEWVSVINEFLKYVTIL